MSFAACAVIPHFNHSLAIASVINDLREVGIDVLVVDDASQLAHRERIDGMRCAGVRVVWREVNGGKGAAVLDGLRAAWRLGYTHALQIDADGQHNTRDIPALLAKAKAHPDAIIAASPVFGSDAPMARILGRKLTNFWVSVETLSLQIPDTMCGFRVYPLRQILALVGCCRFFRRMSFDIEIIVRSVWDRIEIVSVPSAVTYPTDGLSHFRPFLDNVLISITHIRLVAGMVFRLPWCAARRLAAAGDGAR